MRRSFTPPKALRLFAAGIILAVAAAAGLFYRPIVILDGERTISLSPRLDAPTWNAGQALYRAGIALDPHDTVTPALTSPIPLSGRVQIIRAAHVYLWEAGKLTHLAVSGALSSAALNAAGLTLQPGDRLTLDGAEFSTNAPLAPGKAYLLRVERARPFSLLVDGEKQTLTTRRATIAGALWDAGVRLAPGDWTSAPPETTPASLTGSVAIQRARPVIIQVQGREICGRSAAATVGLALAENGVALQFLDYSIPAEDQPLPPDGLIRVVRVSEALEFEQQVIPFDTTTQPDPTLELDQRRVLEPGQYGVQVSRYRVRYQDGQEVSRVLDSDWVAAQPRTQVDGYGTQPVIHTLETPDGVIEYWRAVNVYATAYSPCRLGRPNYCNDRTASGQKLTRGIIAVSTAWYPLMVGQRVYIPGYGFAVIADMGHGIPGTPWIDLGYDDDNFVGGGRNVTMYFLTPIPENVPWILP